MAILSADPDVERAMSLDPKKMRGGLTVKKLADSIPCLADTIPR